MSVGIVSLLLASTMIAGETVPAETSESTIMGNVIDENSVYSEEDFPVDYLLEPCTDDSDYHNWLYHRDGTSLLNDRYYCQSQLRTNPEYSHWSCTNAISLTQNNVVSEDTYHARLPYGGAWLNKHSSADSSWGDTEWYSFSIYEESSVSFNVSASSEAIKCNIYKTNYSFDEDEELNNDWEMIFSQDAFVSDTVCFSGTLDPGGYVAEITRGVSEEEKTYFSIDLFLERAKKKTEYNIADLKFNKNLKAAVWSSSMHPLGMDNFSSGSPDSEYRQKLGSEVCYFGGYEDYTPVTPDPDFDYALNDLEKAAQGNIIPTDIIYVWDKETAREIHSFLLSYAQEIKGKYNSVRELYEVAKPFYDALSEILETKVTVATVFIPGGTVVSIAVSLLSAKILEAFLSYFSLDEASLDTLRDYCQFIYALANDARWASLSDETVLQLPVGYRLDSEGDGIWSTRYSYLYQGFSLLKGYSGTADNYGWDSICTEKKLCTEPSEAFGLPGTFIGLKNAEDDSGQDQTIMDDIDTFKDEFKEVNEIQSISNANEYDFSQNFYFHDPILAGDYRWLKYKASKDAAHAIIVKSDRQITLELFHKQVKGYSTDGRFGYDEASRQYPDQYDSESQEYVCFYDLYLKKNETVYLRVKGTGQDGEYFSAGTPYVIVNYEDDTGIPYGNDIDSQQAQHHHTYGYSYKVKIDASNLVEPSTQHYSYCWKDNCYEIENHSYGLYYDIVSKKYKSKCIKCGYIPKLSASALK